MHLVAHLVVATQVSGASADSDEALGALLPDLASMAGLRLDRSRLTPAVVEGVGLHHRTDEAFHGDPWFLESMRVDRITLEAAGVGRGAARACAHVGIELLLDAALGADQSTGADLRAALAGLDVGRLGLDDDPRADQWAVLFARLAQAGDHLVDGSPEAVAARLERALFRRPRLALAPGDLDALVEVLSARGPEVRERARPVTEAVTARVRGLVADR